MRVITRTILYTIAIQNGYDLNCAEEQVAASRRESKEIAKKYAQLSLVFVHQLKKYLKKLNLPQEIYQEMYYNPKKQNMFYIRHTSPDTIPVSDFVRIRHQTPQNKCRLTNNYKIHLMPKKEEFIIIILKLTKLLAKTEFPHLANSIKIFPLYPQELNEIEKYGPLANELVVPGIVIYTDSRENAQNTLNFLHKELTEFQGINVRPRFSAQINDLIYITQGDSDYKTDPLFQRFYEKPDRIYYNPITVGEPAKNYHLTYPNTDIEVVNATYQDNLYDSQ